MLSYADILTAIFPVFLVMGTGFVMHKRRWIQEDLETGVMKLALNLLTPCLIIDFVMGKDDLKQVSTVAWAMGVGFVIICLSFAVSYGAAGIFGLKKGEGRRTFAIACGIQNYGFIALPVILTIFPGEEGPKALVFIHGLGVEVAMWTVGILIMSRQAGPALKLLINGPFIAVVVSLFFTYTGFYKFVPEVVLTAISMLGRTAIPICLFMIGATIGKLFAPGVWENAWKTSFAGIVLRLGVLGALILAFVAFLPLPEDLKKVLIVQAGMPAAVMPIVIARLYGGHPVTAVQVVLSTIFASIFTAPLAISLAMDWLDIHPSGLPSIFPAP